MTESIGKVQVEAYAPGDRIELVHAAGAEARAVGTVFRVISVDKRGMWASPEKNFIGQWHFGRGEVFRLVEKFVPSAATELLAFIAQREGGGRRVVFPEHHAPNSVAFGNWNGKRPFDGEYEIDEYEPTDALPLEERGKPLEWARAKEILARCPSIADGVWAIVAHTDRYVYFVNSYDGRRRLTCMPLRGWDSDSAPFMTGGG